MDSWDKYQNLVLEKLKILENNNIDNKVDIKTISSRLSNIEKIQIQNAADLTNHIRRTDLAEERILQVEEKLEKEVNELNKSIKSLENKLHSEMELTKKTILGWKANLNLLGWLFGVVMAITTILLRFI